MGVQRKKQIWLFDVLRGVSALFIVLYHYTTRYDISIGHLKPWPVQVPWGCYAVYSFFALSGFLTLYSLKTDQTALAFLKKRAIRLYPVFWAAVIITSIYMLLLMPERLKSIPTILLNFTMVPSLFGAESVDGVYWTLASELVFYFTIAVLIKTKLIKKLSIVQPLWWLLVVCAAFYCLGPVGFPARSLVNFAANVGNAHAFLLGIAIYDLYENRTLKNRIISIASIICSIIYSGVIKGFGATVFFVLLAVCMGIIVTVHRKGFDCPAAVRKLLRPFTYLAEISYPLYLIHQFTGFAIISKMESAGVISEFFIFIPILHAVLLASIMHFGFEVPVTKKLLKRG